MLLSMKSFVWSATSLSRPCPFFFLCSFFRCFFQICLDNCWCVVVFFFVVVSCFPCILWRIFNIFGYYHIRWNCRKRGFFSNFSWFQKTFLLCIFFISCQQLSCIFCLTEIFLFWLLLFEFLPPELVLSLIPSFPAFPSKIIVKYYT